jgi:outer membrane protein, heavy metal efflux system
MNTKTAGALLAVLTLGASGCATTRGEKELVGLIKERAGQAAASGSADDAQARLDVLAQLKAGLTEESAVRVALLNNREILASLEEVGIARAELAQARILTNPEFAGGSGFYAGRSGTYPHFTLTQDVLDLALYPLRRKAGAERFEAARLSVGHSILEKVAHVREAFYTFLAAEQGQVAARAELTAAEAMGEFARRQGAAGNLNELKLARLEATEKEAEIELERRAADAAVARAELAEALGLESDADDLKSAQALAEPSGAEPPTAELETLAMSRRLDLASARRKVVALEKGVSLSRWQSVPQIRLGIERETEADARRTGPELEMQIPLFDRGQARRAGARAQLRQARQELAMLEVRARKEVRAARAKAAAARKTAAIYRERLVPLRTKIVAQTQLHYNFMLLGVDHLLEVKREEIKAQVGRVEALREYWIERAKLELATGGLVATVSSPDSPPPSPEPAPEPAPDHRNHGDHQ